MELRSVADDNDAFLVTYRSEATKRIPQWKRRIYLMKHRGEKLPFIAIMLMIMTMKAIVILLKEKPNVLISTGAEIAIPFLLIGKLLGSKTIFIDSMTRVRSKSATGRLLYPIADVFLVQWPQARELYGPKALYAGSVL
jgi:UDP-N-acetylglucosamine:LPS N-acetylglucosamine transferase